jgi:hypothetical protein
MPGIWGVNVLTWIQFQPAFPQHSILSSVLIFLDQGLKWMHFLHKFKNRKWSWNLITWVLYIKTHCLSVYFIIQFTTINDDTKQISEYHVNRNMRDTDTYCSESFGVTVIEPQKINNNCTVMQPTGVCLSFYHWMHLHLLVARFSHSWGSQVWPFKKDTVYLC